LQLTSAEAAAATELRKHVTKSKQKNNKKPTKSGSLKVNQKWPKNIVVFCL